MSEPPLEERVIELESRHLHLEDLLEKLNQVVIEQQGALERLQREVAQLKEQVLKGPPRAEESEPPPPHY